MKAYLFSGDVTFWKAQRAAHSEVTGGVQLMNTMTSSRYGADAIVVAESAEDAQQKFKSWLKHSESCAQLDINDMVAAQFFDQLLRESGSVEVDWPRIYEESAHQVGTEEDDDSVKGYWLDVNEFVNREHSAENVEAFRDELPEDIRSGLNWSPEKKFLFVVSILTAIPEATPSPNVSGIYESSADENVTSPEGEDLPDLVEKAAAIVVEARNSLLAAWLWKKFARETPLAANKIQVGPICPIIGFEDVS